MSSSTLPKYLFKYFPPGRIGVLKSGLVRYSPPSAFNDPFDGRPGIAEYASDEELLGLIRSLKKAKLPIVREGYLKTPKQSVRRILFRILEQNPSMSEVDCLEFFRGMKLIIQDIDRQRIDRTIGILSLTEIPDSLLMWSHYAASHSGFVLGFNTEHAYFREQANSNSHLGQLKKVRYRRSRLYQHVSALTVETVFLTKSIDWAYEHEWRILRQLSEADTTAPPARGALPIHLFRFPLDAVDQVIVGSMASIRFKRLIWRTVTSSPMLQSPRLKLAIPNLGEYSLSLSEVSRKELLQKWVW